MNFQNLKKVEKGQFYLDKALRRTDAYIYNIKQSKKFKGKRISRSKYIEINKIDHLTKELFSDLKNIEDSFPNIDELPLFYQELIDVIIGTTELKQNLSSISWLRIKIKELSKKYIRAIKEVEEIKKINKNRQIFLGRIGSMFKKINKKFEFLEKSRKAMRNFPSIKTNIKSVSLVGYPNVGKSTLLTKLTPANPEINVYPFTTKGLMLGYIGKKLQIIDTPGAYRENFNKMNYIEKQAYLVLKYISDIIVFVIDLSETCGFDVNSQIKLFNMIEKNFGNKKILIYFSKKDLLNENILKEFKIKFKKYSKFEEFKILKIYLKKQI